MSNVTNIILQTHGLDIGEANVINAFLQTACGSALTRVPKEHTGGNKELEVYVYLGAYNYFGGYQSDFIVLFKGLEWKYPESAILIITPQEGDIQTYQPN